MIKRTSPNFYWLFAILVASISLPAFSTLEITKKDRDLRSANIRKNGNDVQGQDLEIIRKRVIDDLLEPKVNENEIQHLIQSIKPKVQG